MRYKKRRFTQKEKRENENVNLKNCRDGPVGPEAVKWRHETAQSAIGAPEVARAWGTGDVSGVTSGHSTQVVEPGRLMGPVRSEMWVTVIRI